MPRAQVPGPVGLDFRWHAFDRGTLALAPNTPPAPTGLMLSEIATLRERPSVAASVPDDGLSEHVLSDPESTIGKTYDLTGDGQGQCAEYVQAVLKVGRTKTWRAGRKVLDAAGLAIGTAVMTATDAGLYPDIDPRHAGIFMGHLSDGERRGFLILDQWFSRSSSTQIAVGQFNSGAPRALWENGRGSNNASLYWTIRAK